LAFRDTFGSNELSNFEPYGNGDSTMIKNQKPVYYPEYLHLHKLLDSQHTKSGESGKEAHDEMLFIIVHQAYELWFKQILHEMKPVLAIFSKRVVEEQELGFVLARFERIIKIQGLLQQQLEVLETMTPMDFLEFRDLLIPASGFQSVQFKTLETLMGLTTKNRYTVDRDSFLGRLSADDKKQIEALEAKDSLFTLLERWLIRLPFTEQNNFVFWQQYEASVHAMLTKDAAVISGNPHTSDFEKNIQNDYLQTTKMTFQSLFDDTIHNELVAKGQRRLDRKAILNALFIFLYRNEPMMHLPYKVLNALIDIDENFTSWRHRHAMMAHRMLGTKIGTGGTSGQDYLKKAADQNRVYLDLFNLSTFIIPKSALPDLPDPIKRELNFHYSYKLNEGAKSDTISRAQDLTM
jgi:tryptophan 2,3-dioxygenase